MISTGMDGVAFCSLRPFSSVIARTFPLALPQAMKSPCFSVPFCTRIVATGPRPLSSLASRTRPLALRFGLALSSATSAVSRIISSRLSIPSCVFAETSQKIVLPPQSSGMS